jgi:hypothetical protein
VNVRSEEVYQLVLERFDRLEDRLGAKVEKDCTDIKEHLRILNGKVAEHERYITEKEGGNKMLGLLKDNSIALVSIAIALAALIH